MEDPSFANLIRRVRAGDQQAAVEIVQRYEPEIRREVRLRLADIRLRRVFDSMDICQSVLCSFFVRAGLGQYDLKQPDELLRLLVGMTRNKLAFRAREQHAQKRDARRTGNENAALDAIVAREDSPSQIVAGDELLAEFRKRLSEDERQLADLRTEGREWSEIAQLVGGTAESCRKQLTRAYDRVVREMGLEA